MRVWWVFPLTSEDGNDEESSDDAANEDADVEENAVVEENTAYKDENVDENPTSIPPLLPHAPTTWEIWWRIGCCAESIILSVCDAESMILSVPFGHVITLTVVLRKKQQSAILTIAD
jgi:hypothetical protein